MGMAASQARFLGLTARKTNVEYEGQQVNQQRTTLSNQSANYYNDLLGMSVPVPPSVDDYTKTVYTFEDGALENTITSLIAQQNGQYTVSYLRKWTDDFSAVSAATSIISKNADDTYNVGANKLRGLGIAIEDNEDNFEHDDEGNRTKYIGEYSYLQSMTPSEIDKLIQEEQQYLALLNEKYGKDEKGWSVRYVEETSTGKQVPYFYKNSDIEGAVFDDYGNSKSNINCYTIGSSTKTEEVKAVPNCRVEKDSSGRYINITMPELDSDGNPVLDDDGNIVYGPTYSLTTSTATDQEKYEDAMNQYEYQKYSYDQAIQDINSKIEIIQAQDKNLELRLKQLDTEQKAISTEIDAVSKVIEKNTESSFKTFG
ncbi:MAG: hypothetical protein ACLSWI_01420 [Candidatus Gastranaerophilaceae bacterium]